jgi:hypothetical protein
MVQETVKAFHADSFVIAFSHYVALDIQHLANGTEQSTKLLPLVNDNKGAKTKLQ